MKNKGRNLLLFAAVSLPFVLVLFLGAYILQDSSERERERDRLLNLGMIADAESLIQRSVSEMETRFFKLSEVITEPDRELLRDISRKDPFIRQAFLLDSSGGLIFPKAGLSLSAQEEEFLVRTGSIWKAGVILGAAPGESGGTISGWYVWFWGPGANFIYYYRLPGGSIFGIEAERTVFMAKLLERLPALDTRGRGEGKFALIDGSGTPLYFWGNGDFVIEDAPELEVSLEPPLNSYRIAFWPDPGRIYSAPWGLYIAGTAALALVLIFMVLYYYRETTREFREARRKITFVNQVSHELKTPLTNILMYLELIDTRRESLDQENRRALSVVLSETERLRRLITNILTFGRRDNPAVIRREPEVPDSLVMLTLSRFSLSFKIAGIEAETDLHTSGKVMIDGDAFQQILGNLLSNVEKYAADGKFVSIQTRSEGDNTVLTVRDKGAGIPVKHRHRIFQPFYRCSHNLTDAAGTGIGLAVVRDLARRHGGGAAVGPGNPGTVFTVRLHTPPGEGEADEKDPNR
jgi:signal transduction histidine kinase